ncbi:MAG: SDR family oxidoreductase [Deltaproteobacteria bacterium]|nr:SDR family oxidoreductase [Deltaproteobacteria bacterium]
MAGALRLYRDAVAVVTGAASGIGHSMAKELSRRGAIVVVADRQEDVARSVAEAIGAGGGRAEAAGLDVRDAAAVDALVGDVMGRHGRLDLLFNNAGMGIGGEAKDFTLEDWRTVVEVNLMGVIHGVQAAYPRMVRQGFGHIVNTASIAAFSAAPYTAVYGATKHGVLGLSRALRIEARPHGVRVSTLCPGVIRTRILVNGGLYGHAKLRVPEKAQLAAWERLRPMEPDAFAKKALRQIARNRSIIVLPWWWRLVFWLNRLSPDLADAVMSRLYLRTKRELEDAAAAGGD